MKPTFLDTLDLYVGKEFSQVEASMRQIFAQMDENFSGIIDHLAHRKAKYIRPKLLLLSAQIFQGSSEQAVPMAVMVEFMHMASLLHDDVIDQGTLRNGRPTARLLWGDKQSILSGDYLSAYAYSLALESQSFDIVTIVTNTLRELVRGEMLQLKGMANVRLESLKEDVYWDITDCKTGSLFCAALEIGGCLGTIKACERQALKAFGRTLGRLFQVIDDYLDYRPLAQEPFKSPGQDFYEGKITLPVLWAYQAGSKSEKCFWESVFLKPQRSENDFQRAQEALGSVTASKGFQRAFEQLAEEAKESLKGFLKAKRLEMFIYLIYARFEKVL